MMRETGHGAYELPFIVLVFTEFSLVLEVAVWPESQVAIRQGPKLRASRNLPDLV